MHNLIRKSMNISLYLKKNQMLIRKRMSKLNFYLCIIHKYSNYYDALGVDAGATQQ